MIVSIVTPSHNAEHFISDTIDSVLNQTYQDWEMIIVDDCSSDNSVQIIDKYVQKDKRIKLIKSDKNLGPAQTRNKAIESSSGKYIAFLDADDMWMPHKLEKQLKFMRDNDLAFTYASYLLIDEEGNDIGLFRTKEEINYDSILKTCSIGCLTAIYDVEKIGKTYMRDIPKGQDYTLWLNIMKRIKKTKGIMEPLAYYRIQSISVSSNKLNAAKAQWSIYRNIEKLNIFKSIYYFIHYACFGLVKYRQ